MFAVTSEEEKQYSSIIDGILRTADLQTISRKKVREGLETSLGGKDLSDQKVSARSTVSCHWKFLAYSNHVS